MRALSLLLALSSGLCACPLRAQVTATLTLTPGANGINAFMLTPFGAGTSLSDLTQWTGTITVQLDDAFHPTTLIIISASLVAQNSGTFGPALNGTGLAPAAPANYASQGPSGYPLITATRNAQGSLAGGPLALSESAGAFAFAPGATAFGVSAAVDWRYSGSAGSRSGINGTLPNLASGSGSLTTDGSALSFQLPVDATFHVDFPFPSQPTRTADYHFVGTFVATGVIPEPSTVAMALVGTGLLGLLARRRARA